MSGLIQTEDKDLAYQGQRGMLINTNDDEYHAFIKRRDALQRNMDEAQALKSEIDSLKSELSDIRTLLQKLTHG